MTMAAIAVGCMAAAVICVAVQMFVKRTLPLRQYGYFRDVLLAGVWVLLAIWFGAGSSGASGARVVVGCALLAGIAGLLESVYSDTRWRICYVLLGALCAWLGPSIHFIRFADGEYIYLTPAISFGLTTLWFTVYTVIFFHLDSTPGLTGHVLAVTFTLMLMTCLLTTGLSQSGGMSAFFITFAGVSLLAAFWSRFGNAWRQAGTAMSAFWSFLAAGAAILGSSKGLVFSSIFFLSLGLFALPMAELSLHLVAKIFTEQTSDGSNILYRRMIACGLEHAEAVRFVAAICALISTIVALLQSPKFGFAWICWAAAGVAIIVFTCFLFHRARHGYHDSNNAAPNFIPSERPVLWGVPFDNVSMNYAVTRARGLISNPMSKSVQLVATVNALGMIESVQDKEYRNILKNASLVLADGTGLLWGTRFLGMPIQERVTGIDFAEQLCRTASIENWPIYFLGGKGDTAKNCASVLAQRYPGLLIAGARDGYFDLNDASVPDAIVESGAKILLVAMGIPRQEKWAALYGEKLGPILTVGVGGAFDVFSGNLTRAPRWVQKIGMEWFYRLLQEPFRWRRDLKLFSFVMRVFASRVGLCSIREEPAD